MLRKFKGIKMQILLTCFKLASLKHFIDSLFQMKQRLILLMPYKFRYLAMKD